MDGILNVYKEQGFTSFDVVAKLRGICHTRKIGHTGTLDPAAEGVLPVCIGKATGLCEYLTEKTKAYETVMLLGRTTDTQDTTGTVLEEREVISDEEAVRQAILSFVGTYDQIPPMYSAKKIDGKKLYELAREGKEVARKPVSVTLSDIEILEMDLPRVRFRVTCSKGTYIRTLCADIGEKLGCGACMEQLLRIRSGAFTLETALRLSEIQKLADEDRLEEVLIPLEDSFKELPVYRIAPQGDKRLMNGNPLRLQDVEGMDPHMTGRFRIHSLEDVFIGIYQWKEDAQMFWPEKLFLRK